MDGTDAGSTQYAETHRRLVGLCARLTGDPGAAEDLAQETQVEAWCLRQRLHDEAAPFPWLAAIARNLCLRWRRQRGRERAHVAFPSVGLDDADERLPEFVDPTDFTVELERHELAALLERALALLPPATAQALSERYIHGSSHAAIAARRGLSPDAVAMRLTRGKRQLRRLLDGELHDEAAPYTLGVPTVSGWQETRVWCPACGRRRLHGRFERPDGLLAFRCAECQPTSGDLLTAFRLSNPHFARLLADVATFKPAYGRTLGWVHDYYRRGLAEGTVTCTRCARSMPLVRVPGVGRGTAGDPWPRLSVRCTACGESGSTSFGGLVHALPAVRAFWRAHPRMRILPPCAVEAGDLPALVVRIESAADSTYLDVVSARDTYALLAVHGRGAGAATVGNPA